jgi:uncharacterized protein YndB with AHSA1/START domain
MARTIVHEVEYPHPPERVWRALTDPEQIGEWLMETDFTPVVGAKYVMRAKPMPGWRGLVEGEVTEVVPNRRLVYTWLGNEKGPLTTVTWELTPTATGTRLKLTHSGFVGLRGLIAHTALKGGWGKKVLREGLPNVLDGRPVASVR